jgi:elongation factor P
VGGSFFQSSIRQAIHEDQRRGHPFLQDGMDVVMELYNERPISVQLPDQIEATIVEADAVVKGQTASSSYKPAMLDNGVKVMVPPHISAGTRIVVDVYSQEYVRRAD